MGFKTTVNNIKRNLLCCRKEKKKPLLKIGPTTDVRRMDITEGMPDLTEADAKLIQEKATHDAYRLLSLQSHPPTQPTTPLPTTPTDPFASSSALSPAPTDPFASAAPSAAASTTHLPSPSSAHSRSRLNANPNPNQHPAGAESTGEKEGEGGVGKKIWDRTRRLSGLSRRSSTRSAALYTPSRRRDEPAAGVVIELEDSQRYEEEKDALDTKAGASVTVSGIGKGFEVVGTVGGTPTKEGKVKAGAGAGAPGRGRVVSSPLIERAGNAGHFDRESSEDEVERRPLVRV
ncbi:hypothetical protein PMIN06_007392 [Paraphaeosphaeria minitans]|uniref:Uncharacterized protein n=1 Tax=Paraphaeosphaeria minitans TaxID=565426 RepID=A0A9P6GPY1_9PLEO|nr:hypothetical protein PMIN01_01895 [Paraphaeosphaeria minitans]